MTFKSLRLSLKLSQLCLTSFSSNIKLIWSIYSTPLPPQTHTHKQLIFLPTSIFSLHIIFLWRLGTQTVNQLLLHFQIRMNFLDSPRWLKPTKGNKLNYFWCSTRLHSFQLQQSQTKNCNYNRTHKLPSSSQLQNWICFLGSYQENHMR